MDITHATLCLLALLTCAIDSARAAPVDDQRTVAQLDTQYQAAVKHGDADTMARILADDFVLVTGTGRTHTKAELVQSAKSGDTVFEHQEDTDQTVRVWGDTAVVTALLWVKGSEKGKPFDYKLWFSDVCVRTAGGWRYVLGQASLRLSGTP
jgi:ketosteroid isomerase-like protein